MSVAEFIATILMIVAGMVYWNVLVWSHKNKHTMLTLILGVGAMYMILTTLKNLTW